MVNLCMSRVTFVAGLLFLLACGNEGNLVEPPAVANIVEGKFHAGVAVMDVTPPVGVPLAGYGGGERRMDVPDFDPTNYHTWLVPSEGVLDPIYAKALVLSDGETKVAFLSLDVVATVDGIVTLMSKYARDMGGTIPKENLFVFSSHTHSGPGAISGLTFWELIGSDELVPSVRNEFAQKCATVLFQAEQNLVPARFGSATGILKGVTTNRRASTSPNLTPGMVDEELGILRIDRIDGTPLALVWNFGIHGTAHYTSNLKFSADIMGAVSAKIEAALNIPALFANGAEGDIRPASGGASGIETISPIIAQKVQEVFDGITTTPDVTLETAHEVVPFGKAKLDLTLKRIIGEYEELQFLQVLLLFGINPGFKITLPNGWFESEFRFQAVRLNKTAIVSIPGEAIHQLGLQIKADGKALGFQKVFPFGLANGHMGYITTETEYEVGGYEGLATFFGPKTGENLRKSCKAVMDAVKPE
jgi:hypothetical protein